jgi:hypothetical protein
MNDDMGLLETMSVCCEENLLCRQLYSGTTGNDVTVNRNARPLERKPKQKEKQDSCTATPRSVFRLLNCKCLRTLGMLHEVFWQLTTDVLAQSVGCMFKSQAVILLTLLYP